MNLDPRTVVILTILSTLLMSISLFAVARGYLSEMRGVTRWAAGTLMQSIGWLLLALMGTIPPYIAEIGAPLIMLALAFYYHALVGFKEQPLNVTWAYVVVGISAVAAYYFLLVSPDMAARIVVASATAAVLMFACARILLQGNLKKIPVSHIMTGVLFASCSAVLVVRAVYYLVWNTAPDQSAFEQNIIQGVAFLTFFVAAVVSPFTFILMCNDRYNAKALERTRELANKNIELEEASRAKGQFLATMSHELRTPLNGVIGFLGQLGKTRLDEMQKDYLHTIDLSARMLMGVINDILDFSKIEAGKLSMESVEFDLREFLDEIISMFSVSAEGKGIELVYIIDSNVPTRLLGDPLRLTQILSNLLSNAIKFTDQGEVLLEVHALEETDTGVSLEICVTDTGIGISQESINRLFQPFVQADASTTRKHGGTGLGLIIAKRLVEMMGGGIEVESQVGRGTRFCIYLSLKKQATVIDKIQSLEVFTRLKVLIISPGTHLLRSVSEMMTVMGITSHGVNSGVAAVDLIMDAHGKGQAFDVVIFDEAVEDVAASVFAEMIHTDRVKHASNILVLTGQSANHSVVEMENKGQCNRINKPAKFSELYKTLHKIFAGEPVQQARHTSSTDQGSNLLPLNGKLVLIVDDNHINRKLVQLLVEELGGKAELAENGAQGLDACSRRQYDLILMDVNMPVMDGLEATQKIRASKTASCRTPIIALTANALPGDKERFIESGMDGYLSKPINEKSLLNVLNKLFPQSLTEAHHKDDVSKIAESEVPALDPSLGIQLSFGDPDTWHMVLGLMLDDLEDYANKLVQFSDDMNQLAYLSHKLCGSSCYCGTPALHQAAKQLEILCLQGEEQEVKRAFSNLQVQIDRLRKLDAGGKLRKSDITIY